MVRVSSSRQETFVVHRRLRAQLEVTCARGAVFDVSDGLLILLILLALPCVFDDNFSSQHI